MNQLGAAVVLAAAVRFVWLMISGLRGAWRDEQAYKAREKAWSDAHPEQQPSPRKRGTVQTAGLAAVVVAVVVGIATA